MGGRISKGYNGADGNLSRQSNPDGSGQSYFFNGRDQLSAVEMKKAGGALSHRSEFSYDGFGRLVKSREFVRQNNAWVKQSERGRVFDGLDTIQERGAANQVLGHLTRDGNIGGILSRKAGASTSFFGYDGNGNVTLLSDAQGNSVGSYRYDGFGNALDVPSGSAAQENAHRFSTKELHAPSGLYYYGFRFYSPALGRWISRDPIGEAGGVNLYQMVENNSVNFVDEYGLKNRLKGARVEFWNKSSFPVSIVFDTEGESKGIGPKKRAGWKLVVPPGYRTTTKIDVDYVDSGSYGWVHWFNPPGAVADKLGLSYTHPGMVCQANDSGGSWLLKKPPTGYVVTGYTWGVGKPASTNPKTGFPSGYEGGAPNGPSPLSLMPLDVAISRGYITKIVGPKKKKMTVTFN